jgi:AcrR family transcriptional regulator
VLSTRLSIGFHEHERSVATDVVQTAPACARPVYARVVTTAPGTRDALLRAALDALRELTVESLLGSIGVREIARRAGVSPGSIYRHYESMAGLAAAVTGHVYDPGVADVQGTLDYIRSIQGAQLPMETSLALHGAELDRLMGDDEFELRVGLWAFGGPDARAAYRNYLVEIDDRLAQVASTLFESWGRVLRPPFDMRSYLAARTALVNGSTVRHSVEPEVYTRAHYQRIATAVDLVLLKVEGDRHSIDGRLAEINYYPLTSSARVPDSARGRATHARILNAAASAFSTRGYDDTTLAHVAEAADVSTTTLHRYYRTKHALASALFAQQASDALPAAESGDGPEALTALLGALADLVPPRAAPATAYLADVMLHGGPGAPTDDPSSPLVREVARLVRELRPDAVAEAAEDEASLLIGLTIREALNHPARPARDHAIRALDLVLPEVR